MAAGAIFRSGLAARVRHRAPGRLHVVAWALAASAVLGAGASALFGAGPGAFAIVSTHHQPVSAGGAADHGGAPAEALIDPRQFRRTPPPADGRPRVAVLMTGLGLSAKVTAAAVEKLPADVSLSFSPYGRSLQKQADTARAAGHEIFVDVPLEPMGFPANDAGPQAILSTLPAPENLERLHWILGRFTGYAGAVLAGQSPVLENTQTIGALLGGASMDGLVWSHGRARGFDGIAVDSAEIALTVDGTPEAHAVDAALERLEAMARANGSALALASAYPVTVDRLAAWAAALDARGVALVPASSLSLAPAVEHTAEASEGAAPAHEAAPETAPVHETPAHDAPAHEEPAHAPASEEPKPPVSEAHGDHH